MKAEDFEQACNEAICGNLWEEAWNGNYTESVSLSINEMRFIVNRLRHCEGSPLKQPKQFVEDKE